MHKEKDHITRAEDYRRYLDGSMTSRERHAFEKRMLEDEFENEALEGFSEMESSELKKDFSSLTKRVRAKTGRSSVLNYWRIAASFLILIAFSFAVYFMIDIDTSQEIVQSKQEPEGEKPPLTHEEKEVASESFTDYSDRDISDQPAVEKLNEEMPVVAGIRKSEEAAAYKKEESGARHDLNLDEELVNEESIIEDEVTRPIESLALEKSNSADKALIDSPGKIDPQPLEMEEEAAAEELAISKSIAGRAAGVNLQSSRKAPDKKALKIDGIKTITGNVYSSEDEEVLPGVNITIKGTSTGVVTDSEGNYKIEVPEDENVSLVFSYIGFNSKEVKVVDQETIDVNIEPDLTALSEIVVVGYAAESEETDASYTYTPPRPEGGKGYFKDYIKENLKYPSSHYEDQTKGTVKLKFMVGGDGQISDLVVLKSLGNDFDKEAIRLVMEGPKWEPAVENDSVVVRDVKVKIRFRPPG